MHGFIILIIFTLTCQTDLGQTPSVTDPFIQVRDLLNRAQAKIPAHTDSSFVLAKQAEQLASEHGFQDALAQSAKILGQLFFAEAAYNQALENFLKAEKIWETYPNPWLQAANYNHLGNLYYHLKRPDKVILYHQAALDLFQKLKSTEGVATTYGYIGHYYEKNGAYDSALFFQYKALSLYEESSDGKGRSFILENMGSIYEDLEEFDKAKAYFMESLAWNDTLGDETTRIRILNNLGDIHYKTGHYEKAFTLMQEALRLAKKQQDHYQVRSVYRDLAQLYAAQNLHATAYQYLDSSVVLYKQIYSEDGLRQIARLETFFETEKKNREIDLLEKDKRISQLVFFLIAAGLLIVIILTMMFIGRQRMKMRQNKKLYEARQKLMQAQLENNQLAEQQLKIELENKSRSLTTYTLHLIEKNQLLKQVKSELKEISTSDARYPKKYLNHISKEIEISLSRDRNWDDFRMTFEEVHPAFFEKLLSREPDLSPSELKLAALMKMHMSSSEIAAMLGISTDSLRISRYRLRKKLSLEKDQKLSTFLQSI